MQAIVERTSRALGAGVLATTFLTVAAAILTGNGDLLAGGHSLVPGDADAGVKSVGRPASTTGLTCTVPIRAGFATPGP
jgi:hypothetical protein